MLDFYKNYLRAQTKKKKIPSISVYVHFQNALLYKILVGTIDSNLILLLTSSMI